MYEANIFCNETIIAGTGLSTFMIIGNVGIHATLLDLDILKLRTNVISW